MGQVFQVVDDDGRRLDAHYEIDSESIIFHSRGGTKGKGATNTEYSLGLAVLLNKLEGHPVPSDDHSWTEGQPKLVEHLRRERARGAAQAKKDLFRRVHGRLFCERCMMDPVQIYGHEYGEACIEVHHREVRVSAMTADHRTSLSDLQCLCANCHRVVHRELRI
ncbi:hypothetical protein ACI2OW_00705 [Pseudomonas shirazica]|uniref:HNH endonuclease n=1 Tax=Pseudomonas TaxID=286 RepID=UPI003852FDB5